MGNKTAMVWIRKGKGQLVLFGFGPQFRSHPLRGRTSFCSTRCCCRNLIHIRWSHSGCGDDWKRRPFVFNLHSIEGAGHFQNPPRNLNAFERVEAGWSVGAVRRLLPSRPATPFCGLFFTDSTLMSVFFSSVRFLTFAFPSFRPMAYRREADFTPWMPFFCPLMLPARRESVLYSVSFFPVIFFNSRSRRRRFQPGLAFLAVHLDPSRETVRPSPVGRRVVLFQPSSPRPGWSRCNNGLLLDLIT